MYDIMAYLSKNMSDSGALSQIFRTRKENPESKHPSKRTNNHCDLIWINWIYPTYYFQHVPKFKIIPVNPSSTAPYRWQLAHPRIRCCQTGDTCVAAHGWMIVNKSNNLLPSKERNNLLGISVFLSFWGLQYVAVILD